jgi:Integrase core domain
MMRGVLIPVGSAFGPALHRRLTAANQEWALDFAHDVVAAGRTIRVLSVIDAFTRECLALEVDTGFASRRVTRVLDEVIARRGRPQAIRCDNGPELTSRHFLAWGLEWKIELRHIQPGRPMQNGHVESFHGRLREECLRASWFHNLFDARLKSANWRKEYNEVRSHSSLDYRTPNEFARHCITPSYGESENASGVPRLAIASPIVSFIVSSMRILGAGHIATEAIYLPFQFGVRFSTNARGPSRQSSLTRRSSSA